MTNNRIQCDHVEGFVLNEDGKIVHDAAGSMTTPDLSMSPDRDYSLGKTNISFVLCPACAAALKAEIAKW